MSSPAGRTPASKIGSPLTEAQVLKYDAVQKEVLAADSAYLSSVPELPAMLAAFTRAVLREKPADLRAFAAEYFRIKPANEE